MSDRGRAGEELETARLSLRRPTAADIDAIFAIQGDLRACHHNPSDRLGQREEAEALYRRWNDQWVRCGYGYWVVERHGYDVQLGFCGIKPMELNGMMALNLFYRFAPSAWGQGLASEAATAVAAWASRHVPDLPLIARVRPANVASQRVAIRVGLTRAEHLDTAGDDGLDWIFAANLIKATPLPGGRLPKVAALRSDYLGGMHKTEGQRDPALAFPLASERDDADERQQANRAIAVSAVGLAVTGLAELALALLTGSVGLLGDAIHNLSDVSTSAVVFLGFRLSRRPPTEKYPYGLERAEDLAGVGIAVVIWASAAFAG